jgi:D-sedoheptulose 7-phosphate isomerase
MNPAENHDEATGFLYPFIDADETDADALLADLARSALCKSAESATLTAGTLTRLGPLIAEVGALIGRRFALGRRLFTFGNGGSSTDATTLARLFAAPPTGTPVPAWSLTDDQAVLTALGNDVGFDVVFSRQLIARAQTGDVAVALSTSGSSPDLLVAAAQARRMGLYTIAFAGYDGGQLAATDDVDVCFTVDSQSVHRIQEAQAAIGHQLWRHAQHAMLATASDSPGGHDE